MRRLGNEEKELWARVVATVKPLRRSSPSMREEPPEKHRSVTPSAGRPQKQSEGVVPSRVPPRLGGLDASWDRRLARGLVQPDVTVDLHGHSLSNAHETLDHRLEHAIRTGARLVLLITGKPPRDDRYPIARGAIRASIDDWLHASRHAGDIAAVRGAHPRHGGAGALYLVLRRRGR